MKKIKKPWGQEIIIENNKFYSLKKLTMNSNSRCSLQFHKKKIETIFVLEGPLYISIGKKIEKLKTIKLKSGESITIPSLMIHRMAAKKNRSIYLEASTSHLTDVVRLIDDYKRV